MMNEQYAQTATPLPNKESSRQPSDIEVRPTICSICNPGSHCGVDAYVRNGRIIKLEGSQEAHNAGALCAKGAAGLQYIYHADRIKTPLVRTGPRGAGRFEPVSWQDALHIIADRLNDIKTESGPESVIFYAGYPKWMRPFLKRLAHSFGSPNYASESSTCYTAVKLAAILNYGAEASPEVGRAKCLLVWSRNPFYSNAPRSRGLLEARKKGLKIIEVGPLLTPLTRHADIHLRLRPGTSGALALALAHVIIEEGLFDRDFVDRWTLGFAEYRNLARGYAPDAAQKITGVPAELIVQAARLFAGTKPAAIMTGASPTVHHTNGLQNQRAINALIGLTGNFDVPGGNHVFPADYLYISAGIRTREAEFKQPNPWREMAPRVGEDKHPIWCRFIPEAHSMMVPFQIRSQQPYPLRAMLAFGLNYRMWPGSDFALESFKKLDFLVDVDLFMTDTARLADVVLPACTSYERSELKFYPEKRIRWTRPAIEPLGQSRADADIIFDLAATLAPDDDLLRAGHEAAIDWMLQPSGFKVSDLKKYPRGLVVENVSTPSYRKYENGGFKTPSGKMEFTSLVLAEHGLDSLPVYREPMLSPASAPDEAKKFPLILTTGARLPFFIHSRTYRIPRLLSFQPDPMADLNPADAGQRGINQGDWILLSTRRGAVRVRANLTEAVMPGVVNIYHGRPEADVNTLIDPDYRDPISGFPGFKSLLCDVRKC
ncbi:MAG: molybdopterin-dependent oxidoreductase [Desulfobacterales bacterium]|nr:MAG: molybdopterin-dependent oxidoreductase [Desulfobacterales bacterium]